MNYLGKSIITYIYFSLFIILTYSCKKVNPDISYIHEDFPLVEKEDTLKEYSPEIKFEISKRLLEGKHINCIEPNYNGNTWIASGSDLYYFKGDEEKIYNLDHTIRDISISGDETLWIATSGGLGHISNNELKWYTTENSDLPRDNMFNVEVGRDGRIWFSSCASDLGGLIVYDGKQFEIYTPDNSILNQHVISNIEIDHDGVIYVVTQGKVTKANIYRISNDTWECLGNSNGTFYWVSVFTVSPSGVIYLLEDCALSSSLSDTSKIYEFRNNLWKKIEADFMTFRVIPFTAIKADRRDYCWAAIIDYNGKYSLNVYNGKTWVTPPEGIFYGDMITTIKTDFDNNIWIGTANNGVFILKQ